MFVFVVLLLFISFIQVGDKDEKLDSQYLTDEELLRVVALFVRLGVRKIRLTGGEPTTRRGIAAGEVLR